MRTLVLFALALAGIAAFTTDASAFGRRRAAAASNGGCSGGGYASSNYGGCYGSGYSSYSGGGCYGSGYAHSGYGYGSTAYGSHVAYGGHVSSSVTYASGGYGMSHWAPVTMYGGRAAMIQATDGAYYTLGADGIYRPAYSSGVAMLNGGITQSYSGGTVVSRSSSYSPEANPGSGVIPAGGTVPLSTATTNSFRAKQVLGTRILIRNNAQVGTVEDLVSDDAGNMEYLIVSTDDNKLVTVPWDAAKFDAGKGTATVNVAREVWNAVPTYTATTYPQFYTPTYRADIYKVYGLTPRAMRRIP